MYPSPDAAVEDVADGAVVLVSGFASTGWPEALLKALHAGGSRHLTVVCQGVWPDSLGSGQGSNGVEELVAADRLARLIAPLPFYPAQGGSVEAKWKLGELELEVVSQGVLAERIRAGGAGLGGFFFPWERVPGTLRAKRCEASGAGTTFLNHRCSPISLYSELGQPTPWVTWFTGHPAELEPDDGHGCSG